MQRRSQRLMTNVEPVVSQALQVAAEEPDNSTSVSEYIRQLIIKDLNSKGLLTDRMLHEALT